MSPLKDDFSGEGHICGIVNPGAGTVLADGHHIVNDYRAARTSTRTGSTGTVHRYI